MYLVLIKNPSDFLGSVLGESEKNTKGLLAATVGKVLVIDEVTFTANESIASLH